MCVIWMVWMCVSTHRFWVRSSCDVLIAMVRDPCAASRSSSLKVYIGFVDIFFCSKSFPLQISFPIMRLVFLVALSAAVVLRSIYRRKRKACHHPQNPPPGAQLCSLLSLQTCMHCWETLKDKKNSIFRYLTKYWLIILSI